MGSDLNKPTVLLAEVKGKTAFAGGGCVKFDVLNTADTVCNQFHLEINIRPSWGTLLKTADGKPNYQQLIPVEADEEKGEHPTPSHTTVPPVLLLVHVLRRARTLVWRSRATYAFNLQVGSRLRRKKMLILGQE
jgi:hypothetical protein